MKKRLGNFILGGVLILSMLVSAPALAAEDKNEADGEIKCEHNSLKLATNIEGVCPVEGMRIMERCGSRS